MTLHRGSSRRRGRILDKNENGDKQFFPRIEKAKDKKFRSKTPNAQKPYATKDIRVSQRG